VPPVKPARIQIALVHKSKTYALHLWTTQGVSMQFPISKIKERYPRLSTASSSQIKNVTTVNTGLGVRWPDIDEDLSFAGLLRDFGLVSHE
jgi:hypothetical protein